MGIAVDFFHAHTAIINTGLTHRMLALTQYGSRIKAVIPRVAINSPVLAFRKFNTSKFTIDQLTEFETLTHTMFDFLRACVLSRLHIVISGGKCLSKTTLIDVLSSFITEVERYVTPKILLNFAWIKRM